MGNGGFKQDDVVLRQEQVGLGQGIGRVFGFDLDARGINLASSPT